MQPTVGRIVHFHQAVELESGEIASSEPIAAIVTAVRPDSDDVQLTLFQPGKLPGYMTTSAGAVAWIPRAYEPTPGSWSLPPRVGA